MTLKLIGVEIDDLRVNGVKADKGYLNGTKAYERIKPGDVIDGDIVVGKLNGWWYLVAMSDNRSVEEWYDSSINKYVPGIKRLVLDSENDPYSGSHNTTKMVDFTTRCRAAVFCRSISSNHFLPNIQELLFIAERSKLIDDNDPTVVDNMFNQFSAEYIFSGEVWSSSQSGIVSAVAVSWDDRYNKMKRVVKKKAANWYVIPARRIRA